VLFNSIPFLLFFLALWAAVALVPRRREHALLLLASWVFYTSWVPAYTLLLAAEVGAGWWLLQRIVRERERRRWVVAAVLVALVPLGVFKYAGLAAETANPLLAAAFQRTLPVPEFFLPLGISFYSFQMIGLAIDASRGRLAEAPSPSRYALFVSFFPQLIAGPILRGEQLLPQLARGGRRTPERTRRGLWLVALGLVKKAVIADLLLAPFVDRFYAVPGAGSAVYHWVVVYSFAFQIYFDFSGYTDMARGVALVLGYELPFNFHEPYLSRNPAEFWRRWHITLSQWLRDYLYIPLGGNRRGAGRTYGNLLVTMLLGGLWHGATWNFVIWGGLHGIALAVHRRLSGRAREDAPLGLRDLLKVVAMFHFAALVFVFFRAETFPVAVQVLAGLGGTRFAGDVPVLQIGVLLLCALSHALERWARTGGAQRWQERCARHAWGPPVEGLALGGVLALALAAAGQGAAFIYFQF